MSRRRDTPAAGRRQRPPGHERLAAALSAALALAVVGLGGWLLLGGAEDEESGEPQPTAADVRQFRSEPDLDPNRVQVAVAPRPGTAPGYVFLAVKRGPGQDGPMIVDDEGEVVWFRPAPGETTATGFRVQEYRGEPVLTWWQGRTMMGHGKGEHVLLDRNYREVARVRAGNGQMADHHELLLTDRGTAYIVIYADGRADLRPVGRDEDDAIFDSMIQEIDVETGEVLWEWRASDHFPPEEGATRPRLGRPHDYFHINALDEEEDGDLLVSARNMHGIYKVSRRTGEVIWRLNGTRSDFAMGPGTRFHFQHDVVRRPDGTITLFDNQATPPKAEESRGLVLRLDEERMTATLVREYTHPRKLLSIAEASMQTLPNGNVFLGWGPEPHVSEHSPDGRLLFDLTIPPGSDSYQAFRHEWRGEPQDPPAIAAERDGANRLTAWASWNGATEVRSWQLLAGDGEDPGDFAVIATAERDGFETALSARTGAARVAVRALDADGRPLGTSDPVRPASG